MGYAFGSFAKERRGHEWQRLPAGWLAAAGFNRTFQMLGTATYDAPDWLKESATSSSIIHDHSFSTQSASPCQPLAAVSATYLFTRESSCGAG